MLSLKNEIKEQLSVSTDVRVIRVIEKIFNFAIGCEAEEINFEPRGEALAVNFKAGGELLNTLLLPSRAESAVMAGIKEMAGLNESGADLSRSNFKKDYLGYKIIFSLNIHPTEGGEKLIVNLKRERFDLLGLSRLGFNVSALELVKKNLRGGKGLLVVVSDDDSSRVSALYSLINFLKSPELNLVTVEDTVAAGLPGINQSRLNPRVGFNSGAAVNALRRQDIDAVMISEINDRETAEAAFHLAAAHHLVIAGIAREDFPDALNFFQDVGAPLPLFASVARLVIRGRMVDKNCPACLGRQKIGAADLAELEKKLGLTGLLPRLRQDKIISDKIKRPEDLVFYRSRGCSSCHNSGAGKIGIFEVLTMTPAVKDLIKTGHFSAINQEFKKQGTYSLAEDALIKALSGLIAFDEVLEILK